MSKNEVRQFSIISYQCLANPTQKDRDAEFEFQCSEEASKHYAELHKVLKYLK